MDAILAGANHARFRTHFAFLAAGVVSRRSGARGANLLLPLPEAATGSGIQTLRARPDWHKQCGRTQRSPDSQGRPGPRPAGRRDREIRGCSAATPRLHSWFQDLRPAVSGPANTPGLLAFIQHPLAKALAVEHVSGKHQMGSARLSKGSTVLNREVCCDNFPSGALSISGSLCGRRQIAKGSGHTMM